MTKKLMSVVNEYEMRHSDRKVYFAAVVGSSVSGLSHPENSDLDCVLYVLPSPDEVLLGKLVSNQQTVVADCDVHVYDLRNLEKMFEKPNFALLQALWSHEQYFYMNNSLDTFFHYYGLNFLKENLNRLRLSTRGQVRSKVRTDRPVSAKVAANLLHQTTLYNSLSEALEKDKLTLKQVRQMSHRLALSQHSTRHGRLLDLKYTNDENKVLEAVKDLQLVLDEDNLYEAQEGNTEVFEAHRSQLHRTLSALLLVHVNQKQDK